jgi:hypothetical protein
MVEFDLDDYNFADHRAQALVELEQENTKLRSTISELRREILDLKRKLGKKRWLKPKE